MASYGSETVAKWSNGANFSSHHTRCYEVMNKSIVKYLKPTESLQRCKQEFKFILFTFVLFPIALYLIADGMVNINFSAFVWMPLCLIIISSVLLASSEKIQSFVLGGLAKYKKMSLWALALTLACGFALFGVLWHQ